MRILVCGGRDFTNRKLLYESLNRIAGHTIPVIIQGGACGADFLAKVYALEYDLPMEEYKANWKEYGLGAGYVRNKRMLEEGNPDIVIAFPGGSGTANMIDLSNKANKKVIQINEIT